MAKAASTLLRTSRKIEPKTKENKIRPTTVHKTKRCKQQTQY